MLAMFNANANGHVSWNWLGCKTDRFFGEKNALTEIAMWIDLWLHINIHSYVQWI